MKFLSKLKGSLKRGFTVLCATVMVLTSGILTGTEFQASAAKLNGSVYLSDALYRLSGNKYKETKEQWQAFLTEYSTGGQENYYLGTPYNSSLYAASPKGNQWQGYSGMNCQGFVWYIISHGLAYYNKVPVSTTSPYVPNLAKFNQMGYSYKCWDGGGWYAFITQNNLHYYEFSDKDEMLKSGVLQKGDIIWCVNKASGGTGLTGLGNRDKNHHIGIYMGDGKSDSWWQSGPVNGNGIISVEKNSINPIYGKAETNTYVVIPWAEQKEAPHFDPTFLRIQKLDSETEKIEKIDENEVKAVPQNKISSSLEGAEFTMKYYPGTSATGNPTRTWTLVTDSKGAARLDKDHLKSGTLFTDNDGDAYLPLGTVVIKESKAPTGYKLSGLERTLHIVEKNGKAVIQEAGTEVKYVANFKEDIVRGDLSFNKVDGNQRSLAYIPFLLTNTDTGEKHIIMTDVHGKFSSKSGRGQLNDLDDYLQFLSTDENGDLKVPDAITNEAITQLGVWFGDESKADRTKGALICGHYKLQELRCKNNAGYKLITRQFFISSGVTDYSAGTLIDTTNPGNIVGKKVDEDGNGLAGAVLGLFTPDTTEFTLENTYTGMTAVSGEDGSFTFENVPNGKYVVHEITPPDGYILSDQSYPVTVKVNKANEEVQLGEDIVNHPTTVEFSKVDENGNALSGAKMSIMELGSTSAVDSWTTDSSSHIVTAKLAVGKKYEYWESAAPDGYIKADPIYFTIQADGSVTDLDGNPITLQMVDHATQVEISKYNDSEEPLSGAKMQILDSDKNVVEEWITDGTTHTITGKLIYGKTYTLHEAAAPTGYYTAEDMEFTVGKDTVSIGMVDDATWAGIIKTDDRGHDVIGAVLQVKDKSGNVIEEWTTDGTRHEMRAVLNPDETYILHEVSAPEGYFLSEDLEFTVGQRVIMEDVKQTGLTVGKLSDIQKQTAGQELIFLPGAKLQIIDKNGNVLDEWTTENAQHQINKVLTPGETYTLHEVSAPDGYCVAEDIHFTLNDKGEFVKSDDYESGEMWIRMYDLATKIEIQKTDENGKPLSGAALQVIAADADGKETLVDSWITDGSVHQIYGKLIAGQTYILREASAPKGYAKAADQQFTVGTDGKVQNITMQDIATKVGIDKVDEDGKPLSGAVLQLLDAAGTEVEQWTTDGTTHRIDAVLTAGAEYTLHEVSAPDGYCIAADQKFTVNADGSLTNVKLTNLSTKVQISKTTITGDTELEGAKLEVRDLSGNALDSWTSGKEAHMITAKLTAGQTYVLHETAAPNGYVVSNDIEFTVNADGTVTKVIMKDDTTKVEISKKAENGLPLSGAKMQLLDKDGKEVDAWTTDGKAHTLTAKLTAGATYTLHEVSAPAGYCVAADQTIVVGTDGKLQSFTMTDLTTKVSLTKYEITGEKELAGASLELYAAERDANGNYTRKGDAIEKWTSTDKAHEIIGKLTAGASYILHETAAPNGYVVSNDVPFVVNPDGTVTKVAMKDDTTKVEINKTTEDGTPLKGAVLQLLDKDGKEVEQWTTDGTAHVLTAKLTAGATYVLHEVSAPAGYCKAADQSFVVPADGSKKILTMTDLATRVNVEKLDADSKPLSGAKLQLLDKNGNLIDEWTSDGKAHTLTAKLTAGETYTLREAASPDGYYKAKDITFTVNANGTANEVALYNAKTRVSISKYDITGEKEIPGAKLEVRDKNDNVLDSWTSTGKAHEIVGVLVAGQTYVLHESVPADGYVVANDVEFTVNPDGTVTVVAMYDDTTKVEINKVTEENKPLSGATLQIIDKAGTVVDEWLTDGTAHVLTAQLISGQTYTLHEVSAPAGYVVSPDQQFSVDTDGSVTSVSMTDIATVVRVDKVDPDGKPLSGATLQILDQDENVLDEWITDGTTHTLTAKLTAGQTYTLREAAAPAGYYTAADQQFEVNLDGTPNAITLYNIKTKVEITKYDITGTNPLPGAKLQVKDMDGNVMDEWTSTDKAHVIEGVLVSGQTYILHEETAPDGYVLASDMQFTVNPDGTITTISMKDDTTKVSITKKDITGENEIAGATLEVWDMQGNVIDSWVSNGTAHEISGILAAGAKYILHEVSAPDGYVVATDVEFIVDANGKVTEVTMLDDTTKLHVTKKDITGEKELAGAALEVKDTDGNIIDAWVSDGTEHQIIGVLAVGKKYILHEVSAPNGYVVAEDVEFEVNADGSITRVEMRDDTTKVAITKYEITGEKELPGASMQLLDSKGNVVDAWISTDKAHEIIGVLTAGETYTLHEVSAPNGYVVAADASFTVNTDGSLNVVSMYDDTTKVSISKTDITTGSALAGATLQIIDQNDNVIEEWVSTEEAHLIEAVLTAGETYTLRETSAPAGYVIAEDVSFAVNSDGSVTHVEMQDDTTKVSISKTDITGEKELAGAALEVRDANDNVIDAWVSDGTAHQINGVLVAGATYTLHEVSAPNGYVVAEDVTFTINQDGSVNMVSMVDAPTSVHISKKDITTGKELPGAFLELYDKDNNLVDSWVSTNEAHIIEAVLIAGEKYTLIETSAPNGYVISEKVEFSVNLDNTITHVEMLDKTTKVQISKKAITGEDELPGAVMQVLDKDNNIIDQWTSGSEPHMIEGVLIAGQTYVLHEVSAPAGYTLAKDVTFTVSETGEIDYVQMIDDTTKVSISKTDITGEKNVSGATLQIIDKNGNVIHEWISGTDVNYMEAQLTAGETYTLHETNAPAGYVLAQDQQFTVNPDGSITKVNMQDDTTKVSISKYDLTSGKELPGATLQIIDKNGNVIEEWISTSEAHLIEGILTAGETYTLREISAPNGWTISEDVTFTVNADGTITHVEMYDKPTSVSLRKVDTDGNDIKGAVMQLLDKDGNVVEEWTTAGNAHVLTAQLIAGETYTLHEKLAPAGYELAKDQTFTVPDDGEITVTMTDEKTPTTPPVATPTTPTSTATPKTTSTPKTGDATPVMAIGTGLLASFLIMLLTRRKKRRNRKAA